MNQLTASDIQFDVVAATNDEAAQLESVVKHLRWEDPESAIAEELAQVAAKLRGAARDAAARR